MAYRPQDLFIGVIDLFVLILPGALTIFILLRFHYGYPFDPLPAAHWGYPEAVTAFLFAAYVVGHLVSLAGSWLEDVYFKLFQKWILRLHTTLRSEARTPLEEAHGTIEDKALVRRAAAFVRANDGVLASRIDRQDADRRFIRNLIPVFLIAVILFHQEREVMLWGLLLLLSFLRFVDQSDKYPRVVLEYFIELSRSSGSVDEQNGNRDRR